MRAAWLYPGSDPNYAKLAQYGITWPYFDIREPRLTPAYLDSVKAHAGIDGCGVYVAVDWYPNDTPAELAERTDARLRAIGWKGNPAVMFDVEVLDVPAYSVALLTRWRQLRPSRLTDLTIEGHKGGLFSPVEVEAIASRVRYVVPQSYNGAMTETWDTYAMAYDLTAAGFPLAQVCPFYDAAHLPEWWGLPAGYAFTMERLP